MDGLRRAAALEHHCPEAEVVIVADDGNSEARTVQLDVCGARRIYRDVAGSRVTVWIDTTPAPAGGRRRRRVRLQFGAATAAALEPPPAADVATATRQRIDAEATRVLACTGADSAAIEAIWGDSGVVQLALRGEADAAINECVSAAVGAISVPAGTAPGRLLHPIAP